MKLFITAQTPVPAEVTIEPQFDGALGGHVPCGVTAHGSPGGPLQFGRLEATLAAKAH